jgi:hypothetical protein
MASLEATLKRLAPPPPPVESGPPGSGRSQRLTQGFLGGGTGVQTTDMNSGPSRGEIEQVLAHLASLEVGESGADAA